MMEKRLIAFMNAYSHGKSGGDMVFIEIVKRLKSYKKLIITSKLGEELCNKNNVKATYKITSYEKEFKSPILLYILRTYRAITLILKIQKEDILLGTSDFFPDVLPIFLLKLRHRKVVWVQHIFHIISSSRFLPYTSQMISLWLIKKEANKIVVDNSLLKDELIKRGFIASRIHINYPGVNSAYLKSFKKKSKKFDAIYMAQIRPAKGILELLDIWVKVQKSLPQATLGIIGRGHKTLVKKINLKITTHRLQKNVKMLGFLENDKAYNIINNSKIFVFPSFEEGFGIVGLEAQALGLPVVAWNLPIFSEIFPKGMISIQRGDTYRFAKAVIKLLQNSQLRKKMASDAYRNASLYDWNNTAKRESDIIKSAKLDVL